MGSWVIGDGVGTLTVVGDTVLVGQKCKLLNYNSKYKRLSLAGDTVLIDKNFDRFAYELDSRLFLYNRGIKDFELVYDFNLTGGDEIIFSKKCKPDTFLIFEVGTVEIDEVDYFNINYHFDCILSEPPPNPVCFRNDKIDFIYDNVSCDTKRFVLPEELTFKPILDFFSSDGTLFFRNYTTKKITRYQIFDLLGKQVMDRRLWVDYF